MNRYRLIFLALLAGCGSGGSHTTPPPAPEPQGPGADAFYAYVREMVATAPDDTEPVSIDAVTATTPEETEPTAL